MAGDAFKRYYAGRPFQPTSRFLNATIDAIGDHRRRQPGAPKGGRRDESPRSQTSILIKNTTDQDLPQFAVLGINDIMFTPTENLDGFKFTPALRGAVPTKGTHEGKFVVIQSPARGVSEGSPGAIVPACIAGITPVKIDVKSADHIWARIKDGDATQLESAVSGRAQILWKEAGTGTQWALVKLEPGPETVLVKVTATLAGGGLYTGSVFGGVCTQAGSGVLTLPAGLTAGATVTVLNPEENALPTHWIKLDSYIQCDYTGGVDSANGDRPLVTVSGVPAYRTASPEDLSDHPGDAGDPNPKSWDRTVVTDGNAKGDCPVKETYLTRKHDSEPGEAGVVTRTWFHRTRVIDAAGRELSKTAETVAFTDTFKPCPTSS